MQGPLVEQSPGVELLLLLLMMMVMVLGMLMMRMNNMGIKVEVLHARRAREDRSGVGR